MGAIKNVDIEINELKEEMFDRIKGFQNLVKLIEISGKTGVGDIKLINTFTNKITQITDKIIEMELNTNDK